MSDKRMIESTQGSRLVGMSNSVETQISMHDKRLLKESIRIKGKEDRATKEQVLDPRTTMVILKMINRGEISAMNGCISTGKEANVYHCTSETGDRALKVYKTSILVFKDRDRYVTGEHRFRHGYCKSNPRKMVKLWAEKEMRNLKRLHAAGIPCPEPLQLKLHVLLMGFIGQDGWPAPRLKDAKISVKRYRECYTQCVQHMRTMYQTCKLVHGDLSEYNILYMNKKVYFIDVSQSVEHDHPNALVFLKKDIININLFFKQHGVGVMSLKQLYDFVVNEDLGEGGVDGYFARVRSIIEANVDGDDETDSERKVKEQIDEEVFLRTELPRTLHSITDIELHINKIRSLNNGGSFNLFEENLKRMAIHAAPADGRYDEGGEDWEEKNNEHHSSSVGVRVGDEDDNDDDRPKIEDRGEEQIDGDARNDTKSIDDVRIRENESKEDWDEEIDDGDRKREERKGDVNKFGFVGKGAAKDARKAHKKAVKEAQRERRKTKMKKKEKKKFLKKKPR